MTAPGLRSSRPHRTHAQRGSFLLEALIAVLIVAFGILGLIGLEARVIQQVDDAQYRSEAAFLTNAYIGQMWTATTANLVTQFPSTAGTGSPYDEFRKMVHQRLPGAASSGDPVVTITPRGPPAPGFDVDIEVFWRPPGEFSGVTHKFKTTATIGKN